MSDDLARSSTSGVATATEDWGLRMVETTCKEQFIETVTKMEEEPNRLLRANQIYAAKLLIIHVLNPSERNL